MNVALASIYKGIDIVSFQAVDRYITELPPEDNIDLLAKKECRRNKKLKKEVKAYKLDYSEFLGKKLHTEQKKRLREQRSSNAKLSFNKHNIAVINS